MVSVILLRENKQIHGTGEDKAVKAVQYATMAGDQIAVILELIVPFVPGCEQVSEQRRQADKACEQ